MENITECLDYENFTIKYVYLDPGTRSFFENYLTESAESPDIEIRVTQEFMRQNHWLIGEYEQSQAFLEFQCLMLATGNELLLHDRALFHGASFIWQGKAWIFTAPSGTGKTTQLRRWHRILKKEVTIINGDKPMLESRADGSIWVYSSPWRGKEKLGCPGLCAPLGGIVYLEQGTNNTIRRLSPREAVLPLMTEFVSYPESVSQISGQAKFLRKMLDAVPVWKLVNIGDEDAALLTMIELQRYMEVIHD